MGAPNKGDVGSIIGDYRPTARCISETVQDKT